MDAHMHATVAALGVPYIAMHMRGEPATMQQPQYTQYEGGPVWRVAAQELQRSLDAAVAAGVPAWNIITDPGLGFAKTPADSVALLRDLALFKTRGLQGAFAGGPLLLGPSRKGFLGKLTGRSVPRDRDAATVAAAVAGVACGGADIVRAHNVPVVRDGLRVADALYRAACTERNGLSC
jgi:2-amino-4-hydroxy-6-hydroxymethyldihydropteridine diphosphokinase/dihydropteroate synthase